MVSLIPIKWVLQQLICPHSAFIENNCSCIVQKDKSNEALEHFACKQSTVHTSVANNPACWRLSGQQAHPLIESAWRLTMWAVALLHYGWDKEKKHVEHTWLQSVTCVSNGGLLVDMQTSTVTAYSFQEPDVAMCRWFSWRKALRRDFIGTESRAQCSCVPVHISATQLCG